MQTLTSDPASSLTSLLFDQITLLASPSYPLDSWKYLLILPHCHGAVPLRYILWTDGAVLLEPSAWALFASLTLSLACSCLFTGLKSRFQTILQSNPCGQSVKSKSSVWTLLILLWKQNSYDGITSGYIKANNTYYLCFGQRRNWLLNFIFNKTIHQSEEKSTGTLSTQSWLGPWPWEHYDYCTLNQTF